MFLTHMNWFCSTRAKKVHKRFLKFQAWKLNAKRDLEHVIKHCLINRQLSKTPREQHLKLQIRRGKPYSEKVTVEKSSYNFDLHLVLKFHRNLVATLKDRVQGHRFGTVYFWGMSSRGNLNPTRAKSESIYNLAHPAGGTKLYIPVTIHRKNTVLIGSWIWLTILNLCPRIWSLNVGAFDHV